MKNNIPDTTNCTLHRRTPYGMRNVSQTQLSIARHYGGISYNGDCYTYFPDTDELVRTDVLKWAKKEARRSLFANKTAAKAESNALDI